MEDDQKESTTAGQDDSADENQLKIVEEEQNESGTKLQVDTETSGEDANKLQVTSPNLNNNNELASPSTSSNKAGCSGMGKNSKSVQPNFDFDYNGPPVAVSNVMALELVNRFGLNNAWGAFLKLKGYTPLDKNAPQPPEHIQALKRFRRKIRTIRELFNGLRDKNEDTDPLMSKEFVILLKSSNENGGGETTEQPMASTAMLDIPSSSSIQKDKKMKGKPNKQDDASVSPSAIQPISVQIDSQLTDANNSSNGVPADPTQPKRSRKLLKKETKRESGAIASNISSTSNNQYSTSIPISADAKNQSKIDEIVTNVIDRVMANNQQKGSKATGSLSSSSNVQMLPPTLGVEQLQELYRLNPALFNNLNAQQPGGIHGMQSLLSTVKSSASLNPSVTAPLQLNTGQPAANFLLHPPGLSHHQPPQLIDPQTAHLFFPPPTQAPLNTPIANFGVPFLNSNTAAAIRAAFQHQQGQAHLPQAAVFPGMLPGHPISSSQIIPPHWLGQLDPTLSLQQQPLLAPVTSQKQPPETSRSTENLPTTNVNSSDESKDDKKDEDKDKKIDVTVSPPTARTKAQKETPPETKETKSRKQSRASTTISEQKQSSPSRRDDRKATENSVKKQSTKDLEALVIELREQVEQLESQLSAERTRFGLHKRRTEMLRDKLKKKDDELQTARIDYACQKTDNSALKQQLEQLKAENDEYRKRLKDPAPSSSVSAIADNPSTSRRSNMATSSNKKPNKPVSTRMRSKPPVVETPETEGLEEPSPPHPAEKPSRKRKKPKNEPATTTEEEPEREQGERRKSKRLSGARSKTLSVYSAYS